MEEDKTPETHLTSAAAFVEGGIQEACDDACSICLETFCESDPSTLTGCKHEFHLQCILEWCQRSSQCPMCWQPISLKDPSSQELLDAIDRERSFRLAPSRNTTIFYHPTIGDFELQHLPASATDVELEEHIIQHLAAAAAMGRARHIARREGQRNRSSVQGRPHFLVFSTQPNAPPATVSSSPTQRGDGEPTSAVTVGGQTSIITVREQSTQLITPAPSAQAEQVSPSASGTSVLNTSHHGTSSNSRSPTQSSPSNTAGPSELQSFSESLKSRLSAVSMRYKESITKSTRGWKEKFFSRNTSTPGPGSEARREATAGVATVSHMMECLETRDNNSTECLSVSSGFEDRTVIDPCTQQNVETGGTDSLGERDAQVSCAATSASN